MTGVTAPDPADERRQERDVLYAVGVAAYLDNDEVLELREFHPSGHAGFQLLARIADDVVVGADPRMGLMHRSSEKLFEARDYRQIMMLANRHDWLSAFTSELGVALTVEASTGITPPERATWIRTLLAEANRLTASIAFLTPVVDDPDARARMLGLHERLLHAQELATGGRVHPMYTRIGGVAFPLGNPAIEHYAAILTDLEAERQRIDDAVDGHARSLGGLAVLSREDAIGFGASGPVARASGLSIDLRRDDPYLAYGQLEGLLTVPLGTTGDASARYRILLDQLPVSAALMRACLEEIRRLGDGPVDVPLPKVVRAPEGVTHCWIEGPLGISGYLLASVGEKTPWRLKVRSASFNNVQAMAAALVGAPRRHLAEAVMSFLFVVGDVDR